ncbi:polyamine aminopropyltransferase [Nocardia donostiensis]|uniref:Polyamine aminopropyltransferase n=1 Tax=Nocardia donostiensis TaxID=1538463 RepID=A0A1W0BA99_9NOCA|nr:polyamine aminopropyltransferase [Nocardia donostiensis]ONM50069.1 spermidine synthase [Nocardia donostiensis]OQS19435.1 spermidine synthase [Nocardia donostiensis]
MTATAEPETTGPSPGDTRAAPPARARFARLGLLVTVFVCAACGLVYELSLVTLGSYLIGDTAAQASITLSVMVCAMGLGALAAKPLRRYAAAAFAAVELALATIGGLSVLALYAAYAWLDLYTVSLVAASSVIGVLVGAEIPLLMELLQRIRRQEAGSAVADLFAADYVGALLGGLAFPFLLLPVFGQIRGSLIVGVVNAFAGLILVFVWFRADLSRLLRWLLGAAALLVSAVLVGSYLYADRFEATAQQALFAYPIVWREQSEYQQIVLTESLSPFGQTDTRLFLNGDLQFSSVDEYRYHEALVHPALAGPRRDVLVIGGGDGLALREILRYPDVAAVTLVELDPQMIRLARTDPRLTTLNEHAFADPRVQVITTDAFAWLRTVRVDFDAVIVDLPDPDQTSIAKLYSTEFYSMAAGVLAPGGTMVVQAGSPFFAQRSFWCITSTVRSAGLHVLPYHVDVPSFGDWGFVLATHEAEPRLAVDPPAPLHSLDHSSLAAAAVFPPDRRDTGERASTLMHPVILDLQRNEWR